MAGRRPTGNRTPCRYPFCLRLVKRRFGSPPSSGLRRLERTPRGSLQRSVAALFEYSRRALVLVWTTNKALSIALAALTLLAGVLPAGVAYIGALIVDAVIHAAELHHRTGATAFGRRADLGGARGAARGR